MAVFDLPRCDPDVSIYERQTIYDEEQMLQEAAIVNELSELQDKLDAMEMERNGDLQLLILMSVVMVLLLVYLLSNVVDGSSICWYPECTGNNKAN